MVIQGSQDSSKKKAKIKGFPSNFLLGGCLFFFFLYFAFWPLIWHLTILPKARSDKHQLRVESYFPNRVDNTSLFLDKPDSSLSAYAVWQVPKEGLYQLKLSCDR